MAEAQRTRVRAPEPADQDVYDATLRYQLAIRERTLTGKVVVKGTERPFQRSRQGLLRFYLSREVYTDTGVKDWNVFVHDVHRHSGKHRHQGGLVIFVLEGEGYTIVDGERIDWEAGDMILLPIKPGGCEHQHFNRHADQPCKWIAFNYKPLHDEVGSYLEQQEPAPEFGG